MNRRVTAVLIGLSVLGVIPALAEGVDVSSGTLDVYRTCVLTGVSASSTAVAEAGVDQNHRNSNFGSATFMDVQSSNNRNIRIYLRFDLTLCTPAIPPTASVVNAQLDLFLTSPASRCETDDVFLVTSAWGEETITWNNQPLGTRPNQPPKAQRRAFADIGAAPCTFSTVDTYASWILTSDVQGWVSGSIANWGWMIRDDVEQTSGTQINRFSTAEANNAARGPRLVITYR